MASIKNTGRLAGFLWFLSALAGSFSLTYLRNKVIVPADAAATVANIMASQFWFRAAVVSNLFSQVLLLFIGLTLFRLFKEVNARLARVLLAAALLTVGTTVVNTLNQFAALWLLSGADFLKVFSQEQLNAMTLFFLRLANSAGQGLIEIFWVPYYFTFGLLVIQSKYLPKIIGVLLMIVGAGFAINILQKFLAPQFHPLMFTRLAMTFGGLGGLPTMLWLMIMGARDPRTDVR